MNGANEPPAPHDRIELGPQLLGQELHEISLGDQVERDEDLADRLPGARLARERVLQLVDGDSCGSQLLVEMAAPDPMEWYPE